MLTQFRLKELVSYDKETGLITRKYSRGRAKSGDVIYGTDRCGYIRTKIDGKVYTGHWIAWLFVNGKFPEGKLDHIDGDVLNNRISNLREANHSQNMQNRRKAQANNKTGFLGVSKLGKRFVACIKVNKSSKHLGCFSTAEEAHVAYLNAKRNFHEFCTI